MIHTGDIVVYRGYGKAPEIMKVVKVNPKRMKCANMRGEVWNIPHSMITKATAIEAASWVEPTAATTLTYGSVVRPTPGSWLSRKTKHPLFVVVGVRDGSFMVSPLGGDGGIRYTKIPQSALEVVEFSLAGV